MDSSNKNAVYYDDSVVRQFSIMAVVWGVVGMAVGVLIASQLAWPELNFGIPWLSYGRLRPLHTNAVIFAFGGSALFATSYYVVQRTCQTRLFMPKLASLLGDEVIHHAQEARGQEEAHGVMAVPPLHHRVLHAGVGRVALHPAGRNGRAVDDVQQCHGDDEGAEEPVGHIDVTDRSEERR